MAPNSNKKSTKKSTKKPAIRRPANATTPVVADPTANGKFQLLFTKVFFEHITGTAIGADISTQNITTSAQTVGNSQEPPQATSGQGDNIFTKITLYKTE